MDLDKGKKITTIWAKYIELSYFSEKSNTIKWGIRKYSIIANIEKIIKIDKYRLTDNVLDFAIFGDAITIKLLTKSKNLLAKFTPIA